MSKPVVLVVGSGAREHALAEMIAGSSAEPIIHVAADYRNPGLLRVAESTGGRLHLAKSTDPTVVLRVAEEVNPDLVVIGPEEPLFRGVADELRSAGFTVFGASSRLAEVERSKVFARKLMWEYKIPGRLRYVALRDAAEAREYARRMGDAVVKPARQAGGHGVKVFAESYAYLAEAVKEAASSYAAVLAEKLREKYGDVEYSVIVEERVEGVEYTVMTITDGSRVLPLPVVQDNPHLFIDDLGPETGGMGAVAGPGVTLPFITEGEYLETVEIVRRTVDALRREVGEEYRGALSAQSMLTALWGPTLIEYYARLGDPETAALPPLLEGKWDAYEALLGAAKGSLPLTSIEANDVAVVVKAVAPEGYPERRELGKNHPISVDEELARRLGCRIYYGGVYLDENGSIRTTGSRAVEVVCWSSEGHHDASAKAERVIEAIRCLDGCRLIHRRDIGTREYMERRVREAEKARRVYQHRRRMGLIGVVYDLVPGRGLLVYDYT